MTQTRPTVVQHGRLRRSRPLVTLARLIGIAVAVVVVSAGSVAAYATWNVTSSFKPSVTLDHKGETVPDIGAHEGGVNFLLTGDDSGDGDPAYGNRPEKLNDVTILIHLASDHRSATVVTFPRDMKVLISNCPKPGGGHFGTSTLSMNNAWAYGGLPCAVKTVEDLTGLKVAYAADIGFDGAVAVANILGGVKVCVAAPIKDAYSHLDIAAGEQTLNGEQVVQFLRTRHGVGDGSDLGRISNQQLLFSALVRQTRDQLSNLPKVYAIAKAAASNMIVTDNLKNVNTLVSIALAFKTVDFDRMVFVQYPNHYQTNPATGSSDVYPTIDAAASLNAALKADKPVTLTGKTSGEHSTTDPGATTAPEPTGTAPTGTAPTGTPTTGTDSVALPDDVYGQTAAQQTCAVPFSGK